MKYFIILWFLDFKKLKHINSNISEKMRESVYHSGSTNGSRHCEIQTSTTDFVSGIFKRMSEENSSKFEN